MYIPGNPGNSTGDSSSLYIIGQKIRKKQSDSPCKIVQFEGLGNLPNIDVYQRLGLAAYHLPSWLGSLGSEESRV